MESGQHCRFVNVAIIIINYITDCESNRCSRNGKLRKTRRRRNLFTKKNDIV